MSTINCLYIPNRPKSFTTYSEHNHTDNKIFTAKCQIFNPKPIHQIQKYRIMIKVCLIIFLFETCGSRMSVNYYKFAFYQLQNIDILFMFFTEKEILLVDICHLMIYLHPFLRSSIFFIFGDNIVHAIFDFFAEQIIELFRSIRHTSLACDNSMNV